jgi:hypothetical protein
MPDFELNPSQGKLTFKQVHSGLTTLDKGLRVMVPRTCDKEEDHGI